MSLAGSLGGGGGGGAGALGIWFPDAQPLVPHANDYEGGGSSVLTTWDYGARLGAVSYADGHMVVPYTNDGSARYSGRYVASPAAEFAFYAKFHALNGLGNYSRIGIAVFRDAADSTKAFELVNRTIAASASAANGCYAAGMAAYNGAETVRANLSGVVPQYFRGRMNGANAAFDFSQDGTSWTNMSQVALGYTPLHYGIVINSSAVDVVGRLRFLRTFVGAGSSGINATCIGRAL